MKTFYGKTIQSSYRNLINYLLEKADTVGSTKEINNCCLIVENPSIDKIFFPYRKTSEKYANAELKWYWSGDNSCKTIGEHAKMWLSLSDDGETSNSAYGYIIEKKYGFDQLQQVIELLKKDPNTRRAVLNISDPSINRIETHDMQCTIAIQFLIRNNKLETTVYMRSNDVYFGLPYDYIYFMTLATYIAKKLNVEVGRYTHHATSMHMYLRDVEKFNEAYTTAFKVDYEKIIKENYYAEQNNNNDHS